MDPLGFFRDQIKIQEYHGSEEPEIFKGIYSNTRPFIKELSCDEEVYHTDTVQVFKVKGFDELNLIMKRMVVDCPPEVSDPLRSNDEKYIKFFTSSLSEFSLSKIASTHCNSISPYFLYYTRLINQNKLVSEFFMEDGGLTVNRYIESIQNSEFRHDYVMNILLDSANILFYLESHKIAHNDIKITNFVLDSRGANCKLIDYGVSIWSPNDTNTKYNNKPNGFSRNYASPEVLNLENKDIPENQKGPINLWKSDIYSWGIFAIFVLSTLKESSDEFKKLREKPPKEFTEDLLSIVSNPNQKFFVNDETSIKLKLLLTYCLNYDPSNRITFKTLKNILFNLEKLTLEGIRKIYIDSIMPSSLFLKNLELQSLVTIDIFKPKLITNQNSRKFQFVKKSKDRFSKSPISCNNQFEKNSRSPNRIPYNSPDLSSKEATNKPTLSIMQILENLKELMQKTTITIEAIKQNAMNFSQIVTEKKNPFSIKVPKHLYNFDAKEQTDVSEKNLYFEGNHSCSEIENHKKIKKQVKEINYQDPHNQISSILNDDLVSKIQNYFEKASCTMDDLILLIKNSKEFFNEKVKDLNNNMLESRKHYLLINEVIVKSNKIFQEFDTHLTIQDFKQIPQIFRNLTKENRYLKFEIAQVSSEYEKGIKNIANQIDKYQASLNKNIQTYSINIPIHNSIFKQINRMILNIQMQTQKRFAKEKFTITEKEEIELFEKKLGFEIELIKDQLNINPRITFKIDKNDTQKKEDAKINEGILIKEINNILENKNNNNLKIINSLEEIPFLITDLIKVTLNKTPKTKMDLSDSKLSKTPNKEYEKSNLKASENNSSPYEKFINKNDNIDKKKNNFQNIDSNLIESNKTKKKREKNINLLKLNPLLRAHECFNIISNNNEFWDFSRCKFNNNNELISVIKYIGESPLIKEVNLNISRKIHLTNGHIEKLHEVIRGHTSLQSLTLNCENFTLKQIYDTTYLATTMPNFRDLKIVNGSFNPQALLKMYPKSIINSKSKSNKIEKIERAWIKKY